MNTIKKQFHKTTEQYFLQSYESIDQARNYSSKSETKKYYIKEIPLDHIGAIKNNKSN